MASSFRKRLSLARGCALSLIVAGAGAAALFAAAPAAAASGCALGPRGEIKHVIILQFDNVHLRRDNANVPSDIEQIPALYNFLRDDGTLLSDDHTELISHTADGITSTETGLYPGNEGLGVANDFEYFVPFGQGTDNASAFTYWTDPVSSADPKYEMIFGPSSKGNPMGINTPAPWVPFTRAGCDFAGIGSANMEFENDISDVANVYGSGSPQYALGNWSYNTAYNQNFSAGSNLGSTDFEGLAIHCSQADSQRRRLCSSARGGVADLLPDEPGGYHNFNALFGALSVDPVLTGEPDTPLPPGYTPSGDTPPPNGNWEAPPVYDVFAPNADNTGSNKAPDPGNVGATDSPPPDTFPTYNGTKTPTTEILDYTLNPGFPGFDGMEANNALGYTAAAQEAGIPVTYTYLSDVHDDQYFVNGGNAFGPGEAGHEAQLREYNAAFEAFFQRLGADGINKSNTVFLVTVDEGDHFDGGAPLNPGCNGYQTPCQYGSPPNRNVGEVDVNLPALLASEGDSTSFGFHFDDAPTISVPNQSNPSLPPPGQDSATVRTLERTIASTDEFNPIVGKTVPITVDLADRVEEQILHMVNADPLRTPTFTLFGDPSFYFQGSCDVSGTAGCPTQNNAYAWNHGDIQPEIASTWQGWVGPGVKQLGETNSIWTDHTDARPTLLTLLGLSDDYTDNGRVIAQMLDPQALPSALRDSRHSYDDLSAAYKQLDAPFGQFGMATLAADTHGIESTSSNDHVYTGMDSQLDACQDQRASLVGQIQNVLQAAQRGEQPVGQQQARQLIAQADALIADAEELASEPTPPQQTVCQ